MTMLELWTSALKIEDTIPEFPYDPKGPLWDEFKAAVMITGPVRGPGPCWFNWGRDTVVFYSESSDGLQFDTLESQGIQVVPHARDVAVPEAVLAGIVEKSSPKTWRQLPPML